MSIAFVPHLLVAFTLACPLAARAQQSEHQSTDAARAVQDSLLSRREAAQWDALKARDTTTLARLMGGNLVDIDVSGIKRTSPASTARYVLGCQTASYALADVRVAHFGPTAVITYTAMVDATCWGQKAPSPLYVMTVYEQHGDVWTAVAHSETPAAR